MALAFTFRSQVHSTSGATSYATTAAFTPAAASLMLAFVFSRGGAQEDAGAVAGNGVNYQFVAGVSLGTDLGRLQLWAGKAPASPSNGVVTADGWALNRSGCSIIVIEVTGWDDSGTVAAAIVQEPTGSGTGTSGSISLSAAGNANNRPISAWGHHQAQGKTPRANWTELEDGNFSTPVSGLEVQYRADAFETTASASWLSDVAWVGIAAEIKAAVEAAEAIPWDVGQIPI